MQNEANRPDATAQTSRRFQSVAIIGAGIAGLACAALLARHGCEVTIFDKGRRPGGRVATRRAGGAMFDHGAQFATARNPGFTGLVQGLLARDKVAPWPAASRVPDTSWVGLPGMSALPGTIASDLVSSGVIFETEQHVAWLHDDNSLRHMPASEARPGTTSDTGGRRTMPFDAVLLAIPAPQAAPLLATRGHKFVDRIGHVVLAPCWAVMTSFTDRIVGPDVVRPTKGPLAWIARNSARPRQAGFDQSAEVMNISDDWVLHATSVWTRAHLEDDAGSVADALLEAFRHELGGESAPSFISAHRWRYALVEVSLGAPCLWDGETGIGVCGDWCTGPRIEAAFESGEALARSVMAVS